MSKIRYHGALVRTFGVTFHSPAVVHYPVHGWDQLIYASQGAVTVEVAEGSWVLPAQRALWVPDRVEHLIRVRGPACLRSIYLRALAARRLPRACRAVNVPPLLRELILECVRLGALSTRKAVHRRLAAVLLDQLETLPSVPLQLPQPQSQRALRAASILRREPDRSLSQAAQIAGVSLRTLERLFRLECGMPLGAWLRRLRLQLAMERLAAGAGVKEAAMASGYGSASAFVFMFRREMGATPGRYFPSSP